MQFLTQMEPLSVAVHAAAKIGEIKVNDVSAQLNAHLTTHLHRVFRMLSCLVAVLLDCC